MSCLGLSRKDMKKRRTPPNCIYCGKFMHKSEVYSDLEDKHPLKIWVCVCGASRDWKTLTDLNRG